MRSRLATRRRRERCRPENIKDQPEEVDSRARALARAILQYSFGDGAFGRSLRRRGHDELIDWLIWQDETFGATFWAMETREDGRFLGFCGLVTVDEDDSTGGWRTSRSTPTCGN